MSSDAYAPMADSKPRPQPLHALALHPIRKRLRRSADAFPVIHSEATAPSRVQPAGLLTAMCRVLAQFGPPAEREFEQARLEDAHRATYKQKVTDTVTVSARVGVQNERPIRRPEVGISRDAHRPAWTDRQRPRLAATAHEPDPLRESARGGSAPNYRAALRPAQYPYQPGWTPPTATRVGRKL